jgi:putative hydrolase of the HAD superfamily
MYFSHLIEARKPDKTAFDIVLNDAKIMASQTLFIDDIEENILAAQDLGFLTYHKKSDKGFIQFCKSL